MFLGANTITPLATLQVLALGAFLSASNLHCSGAMPPAEDPEPSLELVVPRYEYPEELAAQAVEGYVLMVVTVDAQGHMLEPYVLRSRVVGSRNPLAHRRLMETHAKYVARHSHFERTPAIVEQAAFELAVMVRFVLSPQSRLEDCDYPSAKVTSPTVRVGTLTFDDNGCGRIAKSLSRIPLRSYREDTTYVYGVVVDLPSAGRHDYATKIDPVRCPGVQSARAGALMDAESKGSGRFVEVFAFGKNDQPGPCEIDVLIDGVVRGTASFELVPPEG